MQGDQRQNKNSNICTGVICYIHIQIHRLKGWKFFSGMKNPRYTKAKLGFNPIGSFELNVQNSAIFIEYAERAMY